MTPGKIADYVARIKVELTKSRGKRKLIALMMVLDLAAFMASADECPHWISVMPLAADDPQRFQFHDLSF